MNENAATPAERPAPPSWDVTKFEIRVISAWHQELSLRLGDHLEVTSDTALPELTGELGPRGDDEFSALVRWNCDELLGESAEISGCIGMRFAHKPGIPDLGVSYYCMVNAPILAYPYIREIISHLTAGNPSGPLVVKPIDVPRFVKNACAEWIDRTSTPDETGTEAEPEQEQRGEDAIARENEPEV